jgi:hypothetical protein
MPSEAQSEAFVEFLKAHPYRASAVPAAFGFVLVLAVTGLTGAWDEPPGVGLPFILAVLVPSCLIAWLGVGFWLGRITQRSEADQIDRPCEV